MSIFYCINDCIRGIEEAMRDPRRSIFDHDYFGYLRHLHEETGVRITQFIFWSNRDITGVEEEWTLASVTDQYEEELAGTPWLQFGIHAPDRHSTYNTMTLSEIRESRTEIGRALKTFSGKALSPVSKPHYYVTGTADLVEIMSDEGINTILMPEDDRKVAGALTKEETLQVRKSGELKKDGTTYLRTDLCLDNPNLSIDEMKTIIDDVLDQGKPAWSTTTSGRCSDRTTSSGAKSIQC